MDNVPSKRLRLRFFPEDDKALDDMLEVTSHTSKSSVIRGALMLLDQVWTNKQSGFRVLYIRDGAADRTDVLDTAFVRPRREKAEGAESSARPKTEKSIEIRLSRTDEERIERLLGMDAANTFSEVVRRAIRLYAAVVTRSRDGWKIAVLSPSGDVLPVSVPGLGAEAPTGSMPAALPQEGLRAASRALAQPGSLVDVLPKSLADSVRALAAREGCAADLLLVDIVRTEAYARLHGLEKATPAPPPAAEPEPVEMEPVPPAEAEVLPEPEALPEPEPEPAPAPVVSALAPPEPAVRDADMAVIEELSRTLDQMADNIEKVMQLAGAATKSKDQQAQLTDLFLSRSGELVGLEDLSPTERLFQRAQELNERLTALVSLTQRERKPRKPKAPKTGEPTENLESGAPESA